MTLALSKKDQCLLIGLLGGLFLFVAWYFVYTPFVEKTEAIEAENVVLKEKADLYQSINANLPTYEEGIELYQREVTEIGNRYPANISREDEIMFLANMENTYTHDLTIENIVMSNVMEVLAGGMVNEEIVAAEEVAETTEAPEEAVAEIHLYKQPVNYSFRCTYKGAKDMISYVLGQSSTKSIEALTLAFDSESGHLMGSLDLNQYYMLGLEKEYQAIQIPTVPKGVRDVFHTVNGNQGE